jgi:hypothetical protein
MSSRALRFALAALVLAAFVGAAYVMWKAESEGRAAASAARNFDARIRLASRSLLDIKSAQAGYVAAGQGDDFWSARVDALLASTRESLTTLRSQARIVQAQSELESAAGALEDFEQMDRRARDYAREGQRLLASDLVFSDGIEKVDTAVTALDRARDIELQAADNGVEQQRRRQLAAVAAAAAVSLLALMVLTPVARGAPSIPIEGPRAKEPAADYPVQARTVAPAPPPAAPPPAPIPPRAITSETAAVETSRTIDLQAVASLCTDLGRVLDTRALPGALERAASVLDASGIVLWIADPDGRELAPIVAHGYPQNLVARLGTIPHDAENVTAAAFRTGVVQTVKADTISHGAIAAPLLAPTGPVGVMAAEVRNDGERHEATRAAAAIIAAQLATLMGPPSSRAPGKAEAAGA